MIVSERDAKAKWCPFGSMVEHTQKVSGINRIGGTGVTMCLGSGCMLWEYTGNATESGALTGYCTMAHQRAATQGSMFEQVFGKR